MKHPLKRLTLNAVSLLAPSFAAVDLSASGSASDWGQEIETRRSEYLEWVVEHFGKIELDMKPLDGRAWSLNQARLFLNRDTDRASRYFAGIGLTADPDFMGIRLLKTLLDFGKSGRLSAEAKEHLRNIIRGWPMDRASSISRRATWPPTFTENHDLMHLTRRWLCCDSVESLGAARL